MQKARGRGSLLVELAEHTDEIRRDHDRVVVGAATEFRERLETAQPLGGRIRVDLRGRLQRFGNLELEAGARDFRFAFALGASLHGHGFFDASVLDGEVQDFDRDDGHAPGCHLRLQRRDDGRRERRAVVEDVVEVFAGRDFRDGRDRTRVDGFIGVVDVHGVVFHVVSTEMGGDGKRQAKRHVVLRQELLDRDRTDHVVRQDGIVDFVEDRIDPDEARAGRANVLAEQQDGEPLPLVDDVNAAEEVDAHACAERLRDANRMRQERPFLDVREAEEVRSEFDDDENNDEEWRHG